MLVFSPTYFTNIYLNFYLHQHTASSTSLQPKILFTLIFKKFATSAWQLHDADPPEVDPFVPPDELPPLEAEQELEVAQLITFFFFPVKVFVTPLTVQLRVSFLPDAATQLKLALGLADWALAKVLHCGLGSPAG